MTAVVQHHMIGMNRFEHDARFDGIAYGIDQRNDIGRRQHRITDPVGTRLQIDTAELQIMRRRAGRGLGRRHRRFARNFPKQAQSFEPDAVSVRAGRRMPGRRLHPGDRRPFDP